LIGFKLFIYKSINQKMKKIIQLLVLAMVFSASAQSQLTATDWQNDLKVLQSTVHKDYSFLFKKTTAEAFDAQVESLYNEIPELEDHQITLGIARIVSSFKYGHTDVGFRYQQLPINLYQFNDGVFIQGVHTDYKQAIGAKVIAIGDVSIGDAIKAVYPAVPVENDQYFKAYGLNYLRIPEVLHAQGIIKDLSDTVEFTLEKDGKIFKQSFKTLANKERVPTQYGFVKQKGDWLDARDSGELPLYIKHLDKIYYYEYLPEYKAVYVRHSQIQDDSTENIPAFYKRLFEYIDHSDVERLILDVRLNGGGNNYKNKAVIKGLIRSKKINKQGHLFVITGRRTFSACQNLVNEIDTYTDAIFVGEPTAENVNFYGDNRKIELPNSKLPVYLSFAWWQDKPQWENGPWTAPHIAVDMSFADYKSNRDPVLETTLSFSDPNFIMDPMQHLTDLFMSGKMEQIKVDAKAMVSNPRYQFFDFEGQLNRAGYKVMGNGQMEPAVFIFQLVTELFPNSANAWDSLGEVHLKMKAFDKAKTYYQKAIALDPQGETGKNARAMLNEINN